MIDLVFWAPVIVGGTVAGASSGLLGAFIVGMRISFIGVCMAHCALAGAVIGGLIGLEGQQLLLPSLAASIIAGVALGMINPEKTRLDDNVILGFLFSATMGLAFLGLGLYSILGKSDNDVRSLLWGSLNFCRWRDVYFMLGGCLLLAVYILIFSKEMKAIMFSRPVAEASGIHSNLIWTGFLILAAIVLTVNFQSVGGLMIYSLITNPAAAAFAITKGFNRSVLTSILFGAMSGLFGFLISAFTNLPSGAVIVLFSSLLLAIAPAIKRFAKK
ncbi:MAG: metal ABC transporter permease [Verrucomicrobiia bacterium]